MTKKIFGLIVILAFVMACVCVVIDYGAQVGAAAGLLFGALFGPWRIAGVDFRQWFRDPGAPSEIGDDSWIGLFRGAFHAIWPTALFTFVVLVYFLKGRLPSSCTTIDVSYLLALLPSWSAEFLTSCSGHSAAIKIVGGGIVGAAFTQAVVEITWRIGLHFGLRKSEAPSTFLAPNALPVLTAKEKHAGIRRLIVCCDGTWNWPEAKRETNVVRLVRAIAPDANGVAQIVHYHQGVGTGNFVDRIAGGGAGVGLSASVKACYGFLVDNYKEYDEIFLFGFSRGAYIARALGGLIGTIGIMRKHEMGRFADVWDWYWQKKADRKLEVLDKLAPDRFKAVEIECIGVWDTVGALGIPGTRFCASTFAFHDTELGTHVRHAFQALAIDEQRGNFQAAIWVPAKTSAAGAGADRQDLKQMWFPGVHSNIGGGYLKHGLSDTTFLWMLSQLQPILGLNQNSIVVSLDRDKTEFYPGGELQNSRTQFWRLLGAPVPRPVCVISQTEQIHESGWQRSAAAARAVPASDVYKTVRRKVWLAAMTIFKALRTPFESTLAAVDRPDPVVISGLKKKLDWCSWLLQVVGARG
jgi:hypothetical protein